MANQPLPAGFKVPYVVNEVDASGNVVPPATGDTCTVTSSDTTVATIVPDTIPAPGALASGFLVAGTKPGVNTITVTASAATASGVAIGTAASPVDVGTTTPPPPAAGITLSFGQPVSQ